MTGTAATHRLRLAGDTFLPAFLHALKRESNQHLVCIFCNRLVGTNINLDLSDTLIERYAHFESLQRCAALKNKLFPVFHLQAC